MEFENWFKIKKYPHIGIPITIKDYQWVKAYVENSEKVRTHSFLPFIYKLIVKRRFRADKSTLILNSSGKRKRVLDKPKFREIFYLSHLDSLILSKYNEILTIDYESYICRLNFNESIVAYRKIPISKGSNKNKCNIDFAKTAFEFIICKKSKPLTVIIADVTSFFDNLNHKILKKNWTKILNKTTLPKDHYNIFKALTNIKYIKADKLFDSYGKTMMVETGIPNCSYKTEFVRKKIKKIKFFKEKKASHYCEKKEFIENNLNLVISKKNKTGIPQGSPISATLANLYMLDFDQEIYNRISSINGFYQRYSDDLIIICEQTYEDEIIDFTREKIKTLVKLDIEPSKTKIYRFEEFRGELMGFEIDEKTKLPTQNKILEYLGFSFDGKRVLIKNSGFSKFYRSMKRSFKKSTSLALYSKNPDKTIFKSKLYKRFTYKGANRKLIYKPTQHDKTKYKKTTKYYWGNYQSYLMKANDSMKSINKNNEIKRQGRRLWKKFNDLMKHHESRLK